MPKHFDGVHIYHFHTRTYAGAVVGFVVDDDDDDDDDVDYYYYHHHHYLLLYAGYLDLYS